MSSRPKPKSLAPGDKGSKGEAAVGLATERESSLETLRACLATQQRLGYGNAEVGGSYGDAAQLGVWQRRDSAMSATEARWGTWYGELDLGLGSREEGYGDNGCLVCVARWGQGYLANWRLMIGGDNVWRDR